MSTKALYADALLTQCRVIGALMLRDMRTRFGRLFFGYVISILWPLSHLLVLMIFYAALRRVAPIGTSAPIFFATGLLPYILCLYPARWIMMSLVVNEPLLHFPVVKSLDIIVARAILETITAFWVVVLFCFSLWIADVEFYPTQPDEALLAIFATIYLAFSIGFFSAVLYKFARFFIFITIGSLILMWITCGAFFLPNSLPSHVQYYMSFNPLFHSVEWLRSAYYDGYSYGLLDKQYLLGVSTALLAFGLILERLVRGYILQIH